MIRRTIEGVSVENFELVLEALRKLRNECHAIRAMSYDAIKDSAGYTNVHAWDLRINDATKVIESAKAPEPIFDVE